MYIGEEPKTLEECFERLKKWCRRLSEECGYSDDYSVFKLPATEDEIKRYEGNNNIVLPEDYKKFLRFSNGAEIMGNCMTIYGLGKCGFRDEMVPEYYFVIGEQVGDGERIAFDPETKEIFSFYDGDMTPWKIEDEMKRLLDECEEILLTNDVKQEMDLQKSNGKTQEQMKKEMYARIDALYKEAMKKYSNKNKDDQK